jgi:hypothetical protein
VHEPRSLHPTTSRDSIAGMAFPNKLTSSAGAEKLQLIEQLRCEYLGPELAALMSEPGFEELVQLTWEHCYIITARVAVAVHLRELTIGLLNFSGGGLEDIALELISAGPFAALERLFIGDFVAEQQEISWVNLGDIAPLYPFTPKLQSLRLHGAGIELGVLAHPTLAQLEIETGGLPRDSVFSVATAALPKLAYLEVWFGSEDYGGTTDITALRPIFTNANLPKLRHLGLQNSEMQDQIAAELAGASLLAQLESVDLSMGTMHEPGAKAILEHAVAFEHLVALNLAENFIPAALCEQLQARFGHVVECSGQRTPDIEDGQAYYYASVGE